MFTEHMDKYALKITPERLNTIKKTNKQTEDTRLLGSVRQRKFRETGPGSRV